METVKTGWLEKKSVMRWQKRWFALYRKRDSSRAWFAYFDGECEVLDEARAKGAIELSWGAKVDVLPGAGSRFQVILAKHALKCGAADDAARDSWMRALRSEASHAVRSATVQFAGEAWQIDPKYELVKKVGSGAYGCVASARDTSAEARERFGAPYDVAIKKVANVFEDAVDAKRILREVRLMRNWNHPCVLGLYDIVEPSHSADFEDLYIVTPLSTTDLSRVIYSKTALSGDQQLYLFYQTLCGVHYINSAGVIHRDLKPANLLVDVKTCGLKVCDFGLSRCLSHEGAALTDGYIEAPAVDGGANNFTEYVVTRWYRAPEVAPGAELGRARSIRPILGNSFVRIECSTSTAERSRRNVRVRRVEDSRSAESVRVETRIRAPRRSCSASTTTARPSTSGRRRASSSRCSSRSPSSRATTTCTSSRSSSSSSASRRTPATRGSSRTNPRASSSTGCRPTRRSRWTARCPGRRRGRWTSCWACSASTCVEINQ